MTLKDKIGGLVVGATLTVCLSLISGPSAIAAPASQAGIKQAVEATSPVTKVWHCRRWSGGWGCRR